MGTRITARFLWRKWHQGVSLHGRESEWERHICGIQAYSVCFWNWFSLVIEFPRFCHQQLGTFQTSRCFSDLPEREKSNGRLKKCSISHLLQTLRFTLQPIWRAKSQTVTAGSPVWLRWEGHNLSSVHGVQACQHCEASDRGPCEHILLVLAHSHSSSKWSDPCRPS